MTRSNSCSGSGTVHPDDHLPITAADAYSAAVAEGVAAPASPNKATNAAADSASVRISLKFSRRTTAPGHGDMRDAVLVEGFAGYCESEPLIPRT